MDLNSLKDQVSNLTLYDLKAGVRKVQNGNQHSFYAMHCNVLLQLECPLRRCEANSMEH